MAYLKSYKFSLWSFVWMMSLVTLFSLMASSALAATPRINEIRTDQPGFDNDEYFEIFGDPNGSLNDLTYLVLGDGTTTGSGVVEVVVPLNGFSLASNGFFVAAQNTFTLGVADLTIDFNFENSDNVTHLIVSGFTGADGDDLDVDDDGTLDSTPWTAVIDSVALIETDPLIEGEQVYSTTRVGPDGTLAPAHVFRSPDGTGDFLIGALDPVNGDDTPGIPNAMSPMVINEIDVDQPGPDTAEFVELYDGGVGNFSLDGLVLVFFNGSLDESYRAIDLSGFATDADGYFVIGNASVSPDLVLADNSIQNGADAVALYTGDVTEFPNGTPPTGSNLVDAIVYGTDDPDDPGLLGGLGETVQFNERPSSTVIGRLPDGTGDFQNLSGPTPGAANNNMTGAPPVITLNGNNPVAVEVSTAYIDAGAMALDNEDGDITLSIVIGGLPIDTSVAGSHMVTYDVTDSDGNPADQVTRTVNVVVDVAPVILLNGVDPETVAVGETYVDAGAQAIDELEGNLTGNIVVGGLPIDTSATGSHIVTYDVSDGPGNAAHAERTVVVLDTYITADQDADVVISPTNPDSVDVFGFSVASAGDFNGDGIEDVIVGNPPFNGKFGLMDGGIAYLFFGRSVNTQLELSSFDDADVIFSPSIPGGALGASVAFAGDFNGDGRDDVIIGASDANKAYVFLGRNTVSQLTLNAEVDADVILDGTSGEFGRSVAGAGDFNGDSFDDVIVGAREAEGAGRAFVFFGCQISGLDPCQTSRTANDADVTLLGQGAGDRFGASVASAGDFNGDGLSDVLVGAPFDDDNGDNSGRTFMFLGRVLVSPLILNADLQADIIVNGQLEDELGTSVASVRDFNGDGVGDIILGARKGNFTTFDAVIFDTIGTDSGRTGSAYIFLGQAFIPPLALDADQDAAVIINGHGFGTNFGTSVGSAGDFNDDGLSDVLVGAPNDNFFGGSSGSASIFTGRALVSQLTLDADLGAKTILNGAAASDLGRSVAAAGDFNGDGADDIIVGARQAETNNISAGKAYILLSDKSFDNDVVVNLPGTGGSVLFNDNSTSSVLHADTAEAIAVADVDGNGVDDVIASFLAGNGPGGTGGTFISRNQGALVLLDSKIAEQIAVGNFDGINGEDLFLDFGVDGLWFSLNDTAVTQLSVESPVTMAVGDMDNSGQDDVVVSFTALGTIAIQNFSAVDLLDGTPANVLAFGDLDGNGEDDLFASFSAGEGPGGTGGLFFSVNQVALTSLTPLETLNMTSGDFDGSGQDDFLLDFGGATGLVLLLNGASANPLGVLPVVAMASGDVDSNGEDDIILSITGVGTIAFKNLTTVEVLDPAVALDLATGNVDGQ